MTLVLAILLTIEVCNVVVMVCEVFLVGGAP
jgi:hypothetical protein